MFKAYILIASIVVAVISAPSVGPFFQSITASLVDKLGLEAGRSDPLAQTTAEVGTLSQADKASPTLIEISVSKPVTQSQADSKEPQSDALFGQFQAWAAAQKDNAVRAQTVQVQDVPAKVVQDAPKRIAISIRKPPFVQKNRDAPPIAQRKEATARTPRKPLQPVQSAQAQVPESLQAETQWSPRSR